VAAAIKFKTEWVQLRGLRTHPRVQRDFIESHAKKLARDFDPDKFGTISVNRVQGQDYQVFDGQHRIWACQAALGSDQKVPCHVYENLSDDECARITHGLNSKKSWTAIDTFRNAVTARDPVAADINRIISGLGLKVNKQPRAGSVRAVVACTWLYTRCSPQILERTLSILNQSWRQYPEAFDAAFIRGLGLLLNQHGNTIDESHFVRRLTGHGNPLRFLGHARELSRVANKSLPRAVVEVLREEYNKKLRVGRIES